MTSLNRREKNEGSEFEYLCVDGFMGDIFRTRALATAFETGLVDALVQKKSLPFKSLIEHGKGDDRGMFLLIELLVKNRVVDHRDGVITLTDEFKHALKFRDLLELKSSLANFAAHDFLSYFSEMVYKPDQFFRKAKFFRLFSYDRCFSPSKENYEAAKRWMRITTTLTKYEANACMKYYDFGQHRNILDIGGNSGEFVLRICRKYPGIRASVFDLPLVCDVGQEHIRSEPEANRIRFLKGDALTDPLPEGFDLITFKSMLHDWPEREAKQFITNANRSLAPGGTLLIFERGPIEMGQTELSYSMIAFLLFFHSFRASTLYEKQLQELDFQDISVKNICLDTPFFIVTAKKKNQKSP
jgi:SAM-dependent methyltransferase